MTPSRLTSRLVRPFVLVPLFACASDRTAGPAAAAAAPTPTMILQPTPLVRDGKSYRHFKMTGPTVLAPPSESGQLREGDEAIAYLAANHPGANLLRPAATSMFTVPATRADSAKKGTVSVLGFSGAYATENAFDFETMSTITATWPPNAWPRLLKVEATHSVIGPRGTATPYIRRFQQGLDDSRTLQNVVVSYPQITVGTGCSFTAEARAQHEVEYYQWGYVVLSIARTTHGDGTGYANLQRPCLPEPEKICTDSSCGDYDGRAQDTPPPGPSRGGGGSAVSGQLTMTIQMGWSYTTCWVTDWYDQYGNYLETTIDYCF